jgi:S-formylglutathione hydrolase
LFVDQGVSDTFLEDGLRPRELVRACVEADIPLALRMQEDYGHSYYFISTFMEDHLRWHAERLYR